MMHTTKWKAVLMAGAVAASLGFAPRALAQETPQQEAVFAAAKALQPKVVAWRRDIHEHPELGNREIRTAGLVAEHLKRLGYEVRAGVAHTGVVAILRGGKPGGVVALRADMDGLPVAEQTGLPFASKAVGEYKGQPTPVMHACGHDAHVAIQMGAAEILASMRDEIPGRRGQAPRWASIRYSWANPISHPDNRPPAQPELSASSPSPAGACWRGRCSPRR